MPPVQSGGNTQAPRVPQRQRPAEHESDAMSHAFVHEPQWSMLVCVLMQVVPQHESDAPQVRPHAPQFATVSSVVHVPPQHV